MTKFGPLLIVCNLLVSYANAQRVEWVKPALPVTPPARCCAPAVYDFALNATVVFGGATYSTLFNDTWAFSKVTGWKQLTPAVSPPAVTGPGLAYDPVTRTVVLFGGQNTADSNETWTFDGTTWTQQFPPVSPSPRNWNTNGMAFDPKIGKVVLFGGFAYHNGSFTFTNDTWEWDGITKTWTQKFPVHSPSPRAATIAYDASSRQIVLFGGQTAQFAYVGDTWTYDGVDWTERLPETAPPARSDNALAFDPALGKTVMFGGLAGPCEDCGELRFNDTWLWDGTNWSQEQSSANPSPRSGLTVDFDGTSNALLVFGGWVSDSQFTDTTWFLGVKH